MRLYTVVRVRVWVHPPAETAAVRVNEVWPGFMFVDWSCAATSAWAVELPGVGNGWDHDARPCHVHMHERFDAGKSHQLAGHRDVSRRCNGDASYAVILTTLMIQSHTPSVASLNRQLCWQIPSSH